VKHGADISGHNVQGHVERTVKILAKKREKDFLWVTLELPGEMRDVVIDKGYVALDGASLTICNTTKSTFQVMLIAHTQQCIVLPHKEIGDHVNIEADIMGRYLRSYMDSSNAATRSELYWVSAAIGVCSAVIGAVSAMAFVKMMGNNKS
jgi:riboflavin synthase